ncbi:MAG: DNA primase [Methylophilaceae bacterium]|nr:MAG: DNA primase [Methylophilaceae bacterium]
MIPEQFIQELLNRVDVVDVVDKSVPLKKAGANYSACCPFHNEKSPSFTVSPTKQFYHCFGCGAHGTAISFLMEFAGLSFVEAIHDLAKQVGMIVPQEARDPDRPPKKVVVGLQDVLQQAASYYKAELKKSQRAIEYLKGRGLSGQIAAKFQVGFAPAGWQSLQSVFPNYSDEVLTTAGLVVENDQGKRYDRFRDRIMFPIHNQKGEVIGFGGRVINPEDTPKYYNSPETPVFQKGHELYGLFVARRAIRDAGRVLVVEGYMDVVALAQYGIDYAVAALGTATTPFHITKLMRQTDEIVFSFDGDNAGRTAAWRAAMNALPALTDGLKLRFMFLPTSHDPDSYVREFGKEQFEVEVQNAMPLSQYIAQHLSENNALSSQEDKVKLLKDAEPILKQIKAPMLSLMLRKRIAELAQVTDAELQSLLKLPKAGGAPKRSIKRQSRSPLSLKKRFVLLALMRPNLVEERDISLVEDVAGEDVLLSEILKTCLANPTFKPAVLLHTIKGADVNLMAEIEKELHQLEESLDFTLEFDGARTQLLGGAQQFRETKLLNEVKEKPLSALTLDEREMLSKLGAK